MRRRCSASVIAPVTSAIAVFLTSVLTFPVRSATNDWAEGTPGKSNGATLRSGIVA